ncbi:MAG: hypothetical protein H6583_07300 [Alteromonas sp.]|nr:hypothetical protein [Alteromonas sp.]
MAKGLRTLERRTALGGCLASLNASPGGAGQLVATFYVAQVNVLYSFLGKG